MREKRYLLSHDLLADLQVQVLVFKLLWFVELGRGLKSNLLEGVLFGFRGFHAHLEDLAQVLVQRLVRQSTSEMTS